MSGRFSTAQRAYLVLAFVVSLTVAASQAAEAAACDATWRVQPATGIPAAGTLADIAVLGSGNAWAVGSDGARGLISHLVNGSWTSTRYSIAGRSVALQSVDAKPGIAWAVGIVTGGTAARQALVLVNRGSGWRRMTVPSAAATSFLGAVAIRAANDVWIAGSTLSRHPRALHWNGSRFVVSTLPIDGAGQGIDTIAGDGVVMVGQGRSSDGSPVLAWRWTGSSWRQDPVQSPIAAAEWRAVRSEFGQIWAVGSWGGGCCDEHPLVYRWTGSQWIENTPPLSGGQFWDVLVSGTGHVTVAGYFSCDIRECTDPYSAEIWEWTGAQWQRQSIIGLPPGGTSAVFAIDGDGRGGRWAVGIQNNQPLLLRQCVPAQ